MKKVISLPDRSAIVDEAIEWVIKMNTSELSETQTNDLHAWIAKSPVHAEKLLAVSDVWDETEDLSQLAELFPLHEVEQQAAKKRKFASSWFLNPGMAVAALLLVVGSVYLFPLSGNKPVQSFSSEIATIVGEYKTITLSDTSRVILNTNSKIEVAFDKNSQQRRIILQRGEAHFDVAKDKTRPFIVVVGDQEVRAVGTAFNIEIDQDFTEVTVTEGIVAISSDEATVSAEMEDNQLTAGQVAIIKNGSSEISTLEQKTIDKKLSWQKGRVVFEGEKLADVVEEISRYTTKKFVFSDEQVGNVRVGGYFRIGNIEEMLEVIDQTFDVDITADDDGVIYLASEEDPYSI